MAETVTVVPTNGGYDSNGNPIPPDPPVPDVPTLGIAPGNTVLKLGVGGDIDNVAFTVYLNLGSPVKNNDDIIVRGVKLRARVVDWISPKTLRGGMVVLAYSATGGQGA